MLSEQDFADVVAEQLDLEAENLDWAADFRTTSLLDSLQLMELQMVLEELCGRTLQPEQVESMHSLHEVYAWYKQTLTD